MELQTDTWGSNPEPFGPGSFNTLACGGTQSVAPVDMMKHPNQVHEKAVRHQTKASSCVCEDDLCHLENF